MRFTTTIARHLLPAVGLCVTLGLSLPANAESRTLPAWDGAHARRAPATIISPRDSASGLPTGRRTSGRGIISPRDQASGLPFRR